MFVPVLAEEILPHTFEFLNAGWWILHLIAIPTMFFLGYLCGKKRGAHHHEAKPAM